MFCAVAYDIKDDKRRQKLFKLLGGFGFNKQYSLFECDLSQDEIDRMVAGIKRTIDQEEDKVTVYILCPSCFNKIKHFGPGEPFSEDDVIII